MLRRTLLLSTLLLGTTSQIVYAQSSLPEPPSGMRFYQIGQATDFTLHDIDGETITLSDYRGRWVFLHFWASWCGPCRVEIPTITHLSNTFTDDQLKIIMVNTAEDEDTIFTFISELSMELPAYMDRDGLVTEKWKPRGLPTTFLIDPDGMVRYQAIGGREWNDKDYLAFLKQLINSSAP